MSLRLWTVFWYEIKLNTFCSSSIANTHLCNTVSCQVVKL